MLFMTNGEGKNSFSSADLDAAVDTFEDVPDAPQHPADDFDARAYLAQLVAQGREENGDA